MKKQKLPIHMCPKQRVKIEGKPPEICGFSRERVRGGLQWACRTCEPQFFSADAVPQPTAPIIPSRPNPTERIMERLQAID